MSDRNKKNNSYQEYLERKHSQFAVDSRILDFAMLKAVGVGGGEARRVVAGEVNEVYEVTNIKGNFIIRISRSDTDRFTPEKWAMDESRNLGVPCPEFLLIEQAQDKGQNIIIAVETKLPGNPLGDMNLSKAQTKELVVKAGGILALINSVSTKNFGNLNEEGKGEYGSWEEFMLRPLYSDTSRKIYKSASNIGISSGHIDKALEILDEHKGLYKMSKPNLLHGDFGPKHVFVDEGRITGIIDFENAKSGDPILDLAWWSYFERHRPPLAWLKEGYQQIKELPEDFDLILRLYRLRTGMDLIVYYEESGFSAGAEATKRNLFEDLQYI